MNKKINSELIGINDIYFLKCLCTELKEQRDAYENMRKEAIEEIINNMQYDQNIEDCWVTTDNLLNILNKVGDFIMKGEKYES